MASTPFCGSAFMIDIGMIPKAAGVRLTPEDRAALEARLRAPRTREPHADMSGRTAVAGSQALEGAPVYGSAADRCQRSARSHGRGVRRDGDADLEGRSV